MFMFCSLLIVLLCLYIRIQMKFYVLAWKIKGPLGFPFIGNIELLSPKHIFSSAAKLLRKYDSPLTVWLGPLCLFYISDPVNMERVLTAPDCVNKGTLYDPISEAIGSGLLSSKNPEWSSHRKFLTPAFKTKILFQFIPVFNFQTKELFTHLIKFSQLQQSFKILEFLQEYSFNITCDTITGHRNAQQNHVIKSYNKVIAAITKMVLNPLYRFSIINNVIHRNHMKEYEEAIKDVNEFTKECIEENLKMISATDPTELTFITFAINLHKKGLLSMQEVINEINHMTVASYKTSSIALLHLVTLLAMHPEWQEKLFQEIEETFPDKDVELTFDNIQDTPLIDMVIKETFRLLPVLPFLSRVTSADFPLFDDVVLPKGTHLILDICTMHRNPKFWGSDVMKFNPYRFLQHEMTQRHPYVYMPFSKGFRSCIGSKYATLVLKVFIIKVFRRFRFKTTTQLNEIKLNFNIVTKMTKMPLFTVEDREMM